MEMIIREFRKFEFQILQSEVKKKITICYSIPSKLCVFFLFVGISNLMEICVQY